MAHLLLLILMASIADRTVDCYRGRLLRESDASLMEDDGQKNLGAIPPVAVQKPLVFPKWGHKRQDNWAWLRDDRREDPKVIEYLKEENSFTDAVLGGALADTLEEEMKARTAKDDHSVPQRVDLFWYYSYRRHGDQYRVHCRRRLPEGAGVLMEDDVMDSATAEEVSADHRHLAYAVDFSGNETYSIYVRDISEDTVEHVSGVHNASGQLAWGLDNGTLFYTTVTNQTLRSDKLWRWQINSTVQGAQEMIYNEPDEAFHLELTHTRSRKYVLLYGRSEVTKYLLCLPVHAPEANFTVLGPRVQGRKYIQAADYGDSWILLMSDMQKDTLNAELIMLPVSNTTDLMQLETNTTLMPADSGHIAANNSQVLIEHRHDVELEDFKLSQRHLAVMQRMNGLSTLMTYPLPEHGQPLTTLDEGRTLAFEEESYSLDFGKQGPLDSLVIRVVYSSLVTPESTYDINVMTGRRVLKKQKDVLGGFDKEQYRTFRLWAQSEGGVQVPVSVVHRKGSVRLDGSDPLLLYAYGAYGAAQDAKFDSKRLSLLDRGFIYAIAHVRGGGDLGQYWYLDGKMLNKNNTFLDLIAAAQLLIAEGYTSPERLCIWGRSAGGLTIGASINMRPELFHAAILDVPFVDVVAAMSDPSLPLTVTEYEEWGNPMANQTLYEYMLSYSPLENVQRHPYPNMLATGAWNDARVPYWEPAKWVSKTRMLATNKPLILLMENMAGGHFGNSGFFSSMRETALNVLQNWRKLGEGRGLGIREVAMQGFKRGRAKDSREEDESLDRQQEPEQENERLIPDDHR
ncbi:hypothetical protein WJX75_007225 [Coccomyxa subellipsoidea]|uniref:Prolyl endopeptidase n=1 Tax=Coccomyxa subellipsoidea TaxID=248742 RepID=A0ABR2YQ29_9CHLO